MVNFKQIAFSIDPIKLYETLRERANIVPQQKESTPQVRSTVFALGTDPRVGTKKKVGPPEIVKLLLDKDGLDNPFVKIKWRVAREDVDSGSVVGFYVYRRKLTDQERDDLGAFKILSIYAFDRLARKNKKTGYFSENKKAIYNVKRGSIPLSILNPNLSKLQTAAQLRAFDPNTSIDAPDAGGSLFERFVDDKDFARIANIDYSVYISKEKKIFESGIKIGNSVFDSGGVSTQVIDRNFVELEYVDKKVGLNDGFEYFVGAVTKEISDPIRSNAVRVVIRDFKDVTPPTALMAKQTGENAIQLSVQMEPNDNVAQVRIFRRSEDEITFTPLVDAPNVVDCVNVVDEGVSYAKTYTYRVFLQDIHGALSQPKEITVSSTSQRITPGTRSNNLKIPIMAASQDQNSDFARIVISPNDANVSYYELKRRDVTIKERNFAVPSQLETSYGGSGWDTNKFFVQRNHEILDDERTQVKFSEIVFIDDIVSPGHLYQYQVRGFDLFGNGTSYTISTVMIEGKKSIRTPINIRSQIIRGFPFRAKLSWDDDNSAVTTPDTEVFAGQSQLQKADNKIAFLVQRRKLGEAAYESFPLTANNFIIDEVATPDAVLFQQNKVEDTFKEKQDNLAKNFDIDVADKLRRAFKLPNFLKENDIYFYRVAAVSPDGQKSNYSQEFEVKTLPDLSDPVLFNVKALNTLVDPLIVRASWQIEELKARPDYWVIERKIDTPNESFQVIGKAYLDTEFIDVSARLGNQYIYRIKSIDIIGRQSAFFEARLTL